MSSFFSLIPIKVLATRISILLPALVLLCHLPVQANHCGWIEQNMIKRLMKTEKLLLFDKGAFNLPREKISRTLSCQGSVAYRSKNYSKAKQSFGWAVLVDPNNRDALIAKAKIEWILSENDESIKDLCRGLGIPSSSANLHYNPIMQRVMLKSFANNFKLSSAKLGINEIPGKVSWDFRADLAYLPFDKANYWFREDDFNIFFEHHVCEAYQRKYDMLAKAFKPDLSDIVEHEAIQCGCTIKKTITSSKKTKESMGDPIAKQQEAQ